MSPNVAGVRKQAYYLLSLSVDDRYRQQQAIAYWNQRVEANKARWNSRCARLDRNMSVMNAAVNDSMTQLRQDPDAVSEDILLTR